MYCVFCKRKAPADFDDVVNEGWIPSYFAGQEQQEGPVCPDCIAKHLRLSDDGEWEAKVPPKIAYRYN
jgi:hypothetical protein